MKQFLAFALLTASTSLLWGQNFTPFTAKQKTISKSFDPATGVTQEHEVHGTLARSSDGQQLLVEWPVLGGADLPIKSGIHEDKRTGAVHLLSYTSKVAQSKGFNQTMAAYPKDYADQAKQHALGEKVINGVRCLAFPINSTNGGKTTQGGTAWRSIDLDLTMKMESEFINPATGVKYTQYVEVYDLQLGNEPPAGSTAMPQGFQEVAANK